MRANFVNMEPIKDRKLEAIPDRANRELLMEIVDDTITVTIDGREYGFEVIDDKDFSMFDPDVYEDIHKDFGIVDDYSKLSRERKEICNFALACVGKIKYNFGSKAKGKGLEVMEDGYLDCSAFVNFCYWTAIDRPLGRWTGDICNSGAKTVRNDLIPGDIGLRAIPGMASNHTGIFVGHDKQGRELWVHCSSKEGTVVCQEYPSFVYLYNMFR